MLGVLDDWERKRLVLLQELIATIDQPEYGKRPQAVADQLGITVRSVRRLVRQMRESRVRHYLWSIRPRDVQRG